MDAISKVLRRFSPALTQLFLVASTTVISVGYPVIFGLHAYGVFASAVALTFIIHRTADLMIESTIASHRLGDFVRSSLTIFLVITLGNLAIETFAPPSPFKIDYFVLFSLLYSTVVLNFIFKTGDTFRQALFAGGFLFTTLMTTVIGYLGKFEQLSMLIGTINIVGASIGVLIFAPHVRREFIEWRAHADLRQASGVKRQSADAVFRLFYASFNLLLSFGVILIAEHRLTTEEIGATRLFSSIALIGLSLTPINPKMYYEMTRHTASPKELLAVLRPHLLALGIALSGWMVGVVLIAAKLLPIDLHGIELALATYPAVLFLSTFDKVVLNQRGLRTASLFVIAFAGAGSIALGWAADFRQVGTTLVCLVLLYPVISAAVLMPAFLVIAIPLTLIGCCAALMLTLGLSFYTIAGSAAVSAVLASAYLIYRKAAA